MLDDVASDSLSENRTGTRHGRAERTTGVIQFCRLHMEDERTTTALSALNDSFF